MTVTAKGATRPGIGFPRQLNRRSSLLFHWRAADVLLGHDPGENVLKALTGELPTFARTTAGGLTVGRLGKLSQWAQGVPRIEMSDLDGDGIFETPGLLLEQARTNECLRSEELDNAAWSKTNITIAANDRQAPDGATTADKIVEAATTTEHQISEDIATITAGANVAGSFYVRADERSKCRLRLHDVAVSADNLIVEFDLSDGTVLTAAVAAGAATLKSSGIKALGNNWYRIWIGGTLNGTVTNAQLRLHVLDDAGLLSYLGDVTKGLHAWGGQVEEAAFPSSYIPTVAGTVVRNRDELKYTYKFGTPNNLTVYLRIVRPLWADVTGGLAAGFSPGLFLLSTTTHRLQILGLNTTRDFRARLEGPSTVDAVASIPSGNSLEIVVQLKDLTTNGAIAIDVGSGLGAFVSGAGVVSFNDTDLHIARGGTVTDVGFARVDQVKLAAGLRTFKQMQEAF